MLEPIAIFQNKNPNLATRNQMKHIFLAKMLLNTATLYLHTDTQITRTRSCPFIAACRSGQITTLLQIPEVISFCGVHKVGLELDNKLQLISSEEVGFSGGAVTHH
jgi:hypothetical protein